MTPDQTGEQGPDITNDNAFRYPLDVRFFEVDSLGVVFNMWYLGWCDEAMSAFMDSIGFGYATLREQGFDAVLRTAEIEWLDSLQAFQHAEVVVRLDQIGKTSFRLHYDINRVDLNRVDLERVGISPVDRQPVAPGRTRCARAAITYVCVEIDGRAKTPIPSELREALGTGHR